eukprot:GILJ01008716.1.p1 GENE.GILJ01008716.1~~GILJ01008716.1.p1  ORF type:complete len:103 (-),score=11.34 GILJ01008716.1:196-504(-)
MIPPHTLSALESRFHDVIRGRVDELIKQHNVVLPKLSDFLKSGESSSYFAVPGFYGGFNFRIQGDGEDAKLITESWSRVCGGSEQTHEITATSTTLVSEGGM